MRQFLFCIFLCVASMLPQALCARDIDPLFGDTIDRTADDFVLASLCYAEPTDAVDDLFGIAGHCFFRMQCPAFNLDYCFSYESETVKGQLGRFLAGDLYMGMFAIPTDEYLDDFRKWKRSVHEYSLNLSPSEKQELWKALDDAIAQGSKLRFDLIKRGCCISLVHFIQDVIAPGSISYPVWPDRFNKTRRELMYDYLVDYPWERLVIFTLLGGTFDETCPKQEKLILPVDLTDIWQKAEFNGKPLISYKGDIVTATHEEHHEPVTPVMLAWLVFIITLALSFTKFPVFDWLLLTYQAVVGLVLIYLFFLSNIPDHANAWQVVLFNPLPALLWHWRKWWRIPYSFVLLIWVLFMLCSPHIIIEPTHLIFALSIMVICLKEPVRTAIHKYVGRS